MATPRADQTLGQRVKKLEEDFRRIKLVPATTQTAVAPAAVKGAVWIDSSAGNEPKVWDGTDWVPVRDATIAVAQTTANQAASDVAPLVSLTDLAAATVGETITGILIRTETDAAGRVEMGEDPLQPAYTDTEVRIFSADANEDEPARFSGIAVTPGVFLAQIKGFDHTLRPAAKLLLRTDSSEAAAEIEADRFSVFAPTADFSGTLTKGSVPVATTTETQALTNKDLSSLTNAFPIFPYYSCYLAANQTVATGTSVAPTWTDDATSPSSGITRSSGVFTVPTDGRYRVTLQAYWNAIASPAGSRIAQVYTGNVIGSGNPLVSAAEQPSAVAASACLAVKTVRLAAGAQINTVVSHTQGASMTNGLLGSANGNLTYFQIEWVGP